MSYADMPTWAVDTLPTQRVPKRSFKILPAQIYLLDFPYDPADLDPIARPKPKNEPLYHGWTHSNEADSWFLEAHTPSIHENFEAFYDEALKKKVICPKFYSSV